MSCNVGNLGKIGQSGSRSKNTRILDIEATTTVQTLYTCTEPTNVIITPWSYKVNKRPSGSSWGLIPMILLNGRRLFNVNFHVFTSDTVGVERSIDYFNDPIGMVCGKDSVGTVNEKVDLLMMTLSSGNDNRYGKMFIKLSAGDTITGYFDSIPSGAENAATLRIRLIENGYKDFIN